MTPATAPPKHLDLAIDGLRRRREAAEALGDQNPDALVAAHELGLLERVLTQARSIDEADFSADDRAAAAGPLTSAALELEALAVELVAHQVMAGRDAPTVVIDRVTARVAEAAEMTNDLVTASRAVLWDVARHGASSESSAQALRRVCGHLARWAPRVVAASIPDREIVA